MQKMLKLESKCYIIYDCTGFLDTLTLANNVFKIRKMLTNTLRTFVKESTIIKISLK